MILRAIESMRFPFGAAAPAPSRGAHALSLSAVHALHADFVFRSLQRLGVAESDLADVLQEVFVVVHRQLPGFQGQSKITTWLFGICLKSAQAYRRRAHRKHEVVVADVPDEAAAHETAESGVLARERAQELSSLLDTLSPEKRAVLVMFEIEELSCAEIGEILGVPEGTVHSRLHTAREELSRALKRQNVRDRRMP